MIKMKSINDIWKQMNRCRENYHTFDNTNPPSPWLRKAIEIAKVYMDNIALYSNLNGGNHLTPYAYAVRSHVRDTPKDIVELLQPKEVKGLFAYDDEGNKIVPTRIYFDIDTRLFNENGHKCGRAFYHYDNALRPVYLPDGTRFIIPNLSNVCCKYKNEVLYDWYIE